MRRGRDGATHSRSGRALHPILALRLAARQFRRAPGTAFYAALTLAIGFGAATTIYSVMVGFNTPLPVPHGAHMVQVQVKDPERGKSAISIADLRAWRSESRSVRAMGAFSTFSAAVNVSGKTARMVDGATLTGEVFELLGATPQIGRLPTGLLADEGSIVVSHRLWQDWLEGDPDILGEAVSLGGDPHTLVGVMPEGFHFPFREDLWQVRDADAGTWNGVEIVARLTEGVSHGRAAQELTAIMAYSRAAASGVENTARAEVHGFTEARGEGGERTMLRGLLLMVLALVMVSCSNVSNLLLERAAARTRSLCVHQALGAGPGQVVLQNLTEALLIAAFGAALGLVFAYGAVVFVQATLADHWGYFWMRVQIDPSTMAFAGLLGVATALVSGTLPAWRAVRTDLAQPLKQEAGVSRGPGKAWASRALMTGQVAFSCAAVIASVLMTLGLLGSRRIEDGFPADSVIWTSLTFDGKRYESEAARHTFRKAFLDELERHAVVRGAALSTGLPGLRAPLKKVTIGGRPLEEDTRNVPVPSVTPAFFDVFGLRILDGRGFHATAASSSVAVVSEDFVRNRLDGEHAIGRTIRLHSRGDDVLEVRIVGVVANEVIYPGDRRRRLDRVYLPLEQDDKQQLYVTLRTDAKRSEVAAAVARAAQVADPEVPLDEISSISDMLAYMHQFKKTLGTLGILCGLGAIVVVTIGLYGLVAFDVRRRLPEFALRQALGAGTGSTLSGVFRKGLVLILPGVALGLGLTYMVTPLLGVYIGSADSHDPRIFFGALAVYGLIAVLAVAFPARRAAYCNPADVLREE